MGDTVRHLYGEFILRDLLGYAVPGAMVLMSLLAVADFWPRIKGFTKDWSVAQGTGAQLLALALSYVVGQAIAGIAFDVVPANAAFWYWPPAQISSPSLQASHLSAFQISLAAAPGAVRDGIATQRERFAVLTHLTGNCAAGAAVSCLVILGSMLVTCAKGSWRSAAKTHLLWLVATLFLLTGLEFNHVRVRDRRFHFECSIVAQYGSSPIANSTLKRCRDASSK